MQKINFCDALAKPGRYAIDQQRLIWIVSGWTALLMVIFALQVFFAGLSALFHLLSFFPISDFCK